MGSALWREIHEWFQSAVAILKKDEPIVIPAGKKVTYLSFADMLIQALGLSDRAANLVQDSETDFILKGMDGVDVGRRKKLAFLIKENIYPPAFVMQDAQKPLLRGEAAHFLARALQGFDQLFHEGRFMGMEDESLVIDNSSDEISLPLAPNAYLVQTQDGANMFIRKAYLLGGEEVRWIEKDGQIRLFDIRNATTTNVLDRSSSYHNWKVRRTAEQLEQRVNAYFPVGKLVDIIPQKRGESHRVVDLLLKGESASALVHGLRIRNVLGLRDTLFVVDREKNEQGHITAFVFNGKGWGHGVGLCQVGAFGMAQAGAEYKDILKKYYIGIKIDTIY
jgi:stage II sporulation protein D